jgi:hypothetical protein
MAVGWPDGIPNLARHSKMLLRDHIYTERTSAGKRADLVGTRKALEG